MEAIADKPSAEIKLNGIDLVRLSQGFSCIFWGLPIALFLCVQLKILRTVVADPFTRSSLEQLYFSLFVAVLALVCFGAYKLSKVPTMGDRWKRRVRVSLSLAAINLYFSPFLYWWLTMPDNAFYTLNMFAFIGSLILLLFSLNFLSMEFGRFLGDSSLVIESRLFLGINVLVLALPSAGVFVWAAIRSWHIESTQSMGLEFINLLELPYPWQLLLFIVLFLPVSLTLANLWRVKEILVDELKKLSS
jgi:hypothetical protein